MGKKSNPPTQSSATAAPSNSTATSSSSTATSSSSTATNSSSTATNSSAADEESIKAQVAAAMRNLFPGYEELVANARIDDPTFHTTSLFVGKTLTWDDLVPPLPDSQKKKLDLICEMFHPEIMSKRFSVAAAGRQREMFQKLQPGPLTPYQLSLNEKDAMLINQIDTVVKRFTDKEWIKQNTSKCVAAHLQFVRWNVGNKNNKKWKHIQPTSPDDIYQLMDSFHKTFFVLSPEWDTMYIPSLSGGRPEFLNHAVNAFAVTKGTDPNTKAELRKEARRWFQGFTGTAKEVAKQYRVKRDCES